MLVLSRTRFTALLRRFGQSVTQIQRCYLDMMDIDSGHIEEMTGCHKSAVAVIRFLTAQLPHGEDSFSKPNRREVDVWRSA